ERAQLVEGLRTGAWMPIDGLGPAIRTRRCGTGAEIESAAVVPGTPLEATAVLSAADALVTEARRDRAHVIRGGAEAGSTVAAAIAARRLGIDMDLSEEGLAALARADSELPGLADAFDQALRRTETPVSIEELTIGVVADAFTLNAIASTIRTVE